MSEKKVNFKSIISLGIIIGASKLVSLFREALFASRFGTGEDVAVYEAAFRTVSFVSDTFFCGAPAGLITLVCSPLPRGRAGKVAGKIVLILLGVSIAVTVLMYSLSENIPKILAPVLSPEELKMMLAYLLPLIPINTLTFSLIGYLHSREKFLLGGSISAVTSGAAALFLLTHRNVGIFGFAAALVPASAISAVVLLAGAFKIGFSFRDLSEKVPLANMLRSYPSHIVSIALVPTVALISVRAAGEDLSEFSYALKIFLLASGLLTFAVSQVTFPKMAKASSGKDALTIASRAVTPSVVILIGCACVLATCGDGITFMLFGSGNFDLLACKRVGGHLAVLSIALPLGCILDIMQRYLLSRNKARSALFSVIVGILCAVLSFSFGGSWVIVLSHIASICTMYLCGARIPEASHLTHLAFFGAVGLTISVAVRPIATAVSSDITKTIATVVLTMIAFFVIALSPIIPAAAEKRKGKRKHDKSNAFPQ